MYFIFQNSDIIHNSGKKKKKAQILIYVIMSCKRHTVRRYDCIFVFSNIENVADTLFLKSKILFIKYTDDVGICVGMAVILNLHLPLLDPSSL